MTNPLTRRWKEWRAILSLILSRLGKSFSEHVDAAYTASVIMPYYNKQVGIRAKQFWWYENPNGLKRMPEDRKNQILAEALTETRKKFNLPESWELKGKERNDRKSLLRF